MWGCHNALNHELRTSYDSQFFKGFSIQYRDIMMKIMILFNQFLVLKSYYTQYFL